MYIRARKCKKLSIHKPAINSVNVLNTAYNVNLSKTPIKVMLTIWIRHLTEIFDNITGVDKIIMISYFILKVEQ